MLQSLNSEFTAELKAKQDALDVTQAHLRAATRELSEQRKQIQTWQTRCGDLDRVQQRMRNVERALAVENAFDWTGRSETDKEAGPAFGWRGRAGSITDQAGDGPPIESLIPTTDSVASLIRLRRFKLWQTRAEQLLRQRLKSLHGASAEKEFQCKKIIALCTGVATDKVDSVSIYSVSE
jgi:regulatory protein SWI6